MKQVDTREVEQEQKRLQRTQLPLARSRMLILFRPSFSQCSQRYAEMSRLSDSQGSGQGERRVERERGRAWRGGLGERERGRERKGEKRERGREREREREEGGRRRERERERDASRPESGCRVTEAGSAGRGEPANKERGPPHTDLDRAHHGRRRRGEREGCRRGERRF
eukprot:scaffold152956_cov28-Tisochrysis_lutea.AAC.1